MQRPLFSQFLGQAAGEPVVSAMLWAGYCVMRDSMAIGKGLGSKYHLYLRVSVWDPFTSGCRKLSSRQLVPMGNMLSGLWVFLPLSLMK